MIISDKILHLRKRAGLTQEELAEQLEVSRQSVSKWEGAQSIPDIQKIMAMAKLFGVSCDYLLYDEIEVVNGEPIVEKCEKKLVTIETANEYVYAYETFAKMLSISLFLFTTAVLPIVASTYLGNNTFVNVGIAWFFLAVATGTGLIIYANSKLEKYKYIEKLDFELSFNVDGLVQRQKEDFSPGRVKTIIISVAMYITSALPMVLLVDTAYELHALAFLLFTVAFATIFLVKSELKMFAYCNLLKEGDGVMSEKAKKRSELISTVYWTLALAIFLSWSLIFNDWSKSWVVWPIASVLYVVVNAVVEYIDKNSGE